MFSATRTHRISSKSQGSQEKCIISDQACFIMAGADGLCPCRALRKGTVLTHRTSHRSGQGEDLWTLEDFSLLWPVHSSRVSQASPSAQAASSVHPACSPLICFPSSPFSASLLFGPHHSSPKEWQNMLPPSWWSWHFVLWLCVSLFLSAPHCSFQTIVMRSISSVLNSMESCSWLSCLKIPHTSKSQCFPRAEVAALAHVYILMTSKIAATTKEKKFTFIFHTLQTLGSEGEFLHRLLFWDLLLHSCSAWQ